MLGAGLVKGIGRGLVCTVFDDSEIGEARRVAKRFLEGRERPIAVSSDDRKPGGGLGNGGGAAIGFPEGKGVIRHVGFSGMDERLLGSDFFESGKGIGDEKTAGQVSALHGVAAEDAMRMLRNVLDLEGPVLPAGEKG